VFYYFAFYPYFSTYLFDFATTDCFNLAHSCYKILINVFIHSFIHSKVEMVVMCRALATVEVPPLLAGQQIQIGWIQVCRDMTFINSYGREGM